MDRDYVLLPRWALALRGIVAVAFGVILLVWPEATELVLLVVWAFFALLEGILDIIASIALGRQNKRWDILGARSLVQVLLAIVILMRPDFSFTLLVVLIGIWAVACGYVDIVGAIHIPAHPGKLVTLLIGGISMVIGVLFMFAPFDSVTTVMRIMGVYALVTGVGFIALSHLAAGMGKGGESQESS